RYVMPEVVIINLVWEIPLLDVKIERELRIEIAQANFHVERVERHVHRRVKPAEPRNGARDTYHVTVIRIRGLDDHREMIHVAGMVQRIVGNTQVPLSECIMAGKTAQRSRSIG